MLTEHSFAPIGTYHSTDWTVVTPATSLHTPTAAPYPSLSHPLRTMITMVALLNPTSVGSPARGLVDVPGGRSFGRGVAAKPSTRHHQASRQHLRLVETPPHLSLFTNRSSASSRSLVKGVPVAGIAVAVAVVFGLLLAVRLLQGAPPATLSDLHVTSSGSAQALSGPEDQVRIAQAGDTYWALALELAPNADPRPIVDLLVEVNGGAGIDVGQKLLIPAELIVAG